MATSIRAFNIELYEEYLEEASFLYEQRQTLFHDPEIYWVDIQDFEERFEAHIDGLVVGGDLALEVCTERAREGDFGELHSAVRVFCRQNRRDLVLEVLEALDAEDVEGMRAVSDALKDELPREWQEDFLRMLGEGDQKLVAVVARVAGHRRIGSASELLLRVRQTGSKAAHSLVWALGRLRAKGARGFLYECLKHQSETVRLMAGLGLARIGEGEIIDRCLHDPGTHSWSLLLPGLGGSRSALPLLLEYAGSRNAVPDSLIAVGLLGDVAGVDVLLGQLRDDGLAESAALGLNLITGAELYEEAFLAEEIEEDELFDEELDDFRSGKVPLRLDGKPFGVTVTRISRNTEEWTKWWLENRSRFRNGTRYRRGKPFSTGVLLESLEDAKSPYRVREFAYEELVIRYDVDFPFEADMFVQEQRRVLLDMAEWVKSNGKRFRDGEWYFAGQPV